MFARPLDYPADLPALDRLFGLCQSHDGHHPLSEHKYASLRRGDPHGDGFAVERERRIVGYVHLLESRRAGTFELEKAVEPPYRGLVDEHLLLAALEKVRQRDGEEVHAWVYQRGEVRSLEDLGFELVRRLIQMRVALPVVDQIIPPGIEFRGYEPSDEAQLLHIHNRAFEGHLEAGNWSPQDLHERQAYEWYDPAGLRTAWKGERLVAFCWTKVHSGGLGEIYLIATDPDQRGRGYGRAAALDGLRFLNRRAGSTTGMLYVDAANDSALRLYEQLGFRCHHTDLDFRLRI